MYRDLVMDEYVRLDYEVKMGSQCLDFDSIELGRLAGLWLDSQKTVLGRSRGAVGFDDQNLG